LSTLSLIENAIKKQSKKICLLKDKINRLENALRYHQHLQNKQILPPRFSPKCFIETEDISLHNTFKQNFKKIFFEHLTAVINNNTISIQLKKALLETEIKQTENILINSSEESQEKLNFLYQKFLQETNTSQPNELNPALIHKLKLQSTATKGELINSTAYDEIMSRKRKSTEQQPTNCKQPKMSNHFLGLSHTHKPKSF
jgi:hypothetical protein